MHQNFEHMLTAMLKFIGPMVKLSVFGKTAIFLGNGRSISELFAKRSSDFSDRPTLVFSGELYVLDTAERPQSTDLDPIVVASIVYTP